MSSKIRNRKVPLNRKSLEKNVDYLHGGDCPPSDDSFLSHESISAPTSNDPNGREVYQDKNGIRVKSAISMLRDRTSPLKIDNFLDESHISSDDTTSIYCRPTLRESQDNYELSDSDEDASDKDEENNVEDHFALLDGGENAYKRTLTKSIGNESVGAELPCKRSRVENSDTVKFAQTNGFSIKLEPPSLDDDDSAIVLDIVGCDVDIGVKDEGLADEDYILLNDLKNCEPALPSEGLCFEDDYFKSGIDTILSPIKLEEADTVLLPSNNELIDYVLEEEEVEEEELASVRERLAREVASEVPITPVRNNGIYSVVGPLVSDICWMFSSESEYKYLCDNDFSFEIFQSLCHRDETSRRTLAVSEATNGIASNVTALACRSEFRAADRRSIILQVFSRRRGLALSSETLHLGIALLDKCLSLYVVESNALAQIAAVSMVLASKMEEYNALRLSDVIVSGIVEGVDVATLGQLEKHLFQLLDFRLDLPTPFTMSTFLLVRLDASSEQIHLSHYLLELALLNVSFHAFTSVRVAHAAVCLAYAILPKDNANSVLALSVAENELSTFSLVNIASTRDIMHALILEFELATEELHAIFSEYESAGRENVAVVQLDSGLMELIKA